MTVTAQRRFIPAPDKLQAAWLGFVSDAQSAAEKHGIAHSMNVPDFAYQWPAALSWSDSIMRGIESPAGFQFVVRDGKIGAEVWKAL